MSSFGLVFKTYPVIITEMGPIAGRVFGAVFFLALIVAGISSSISIVEAFTAALSDDFGWERGRIVAVVCSVGFLLGIVFCTQAGLYWLDLFDHFITTYGLVIVAICESLIVRWIFTAKRLRTHLDRHRDFSNGKATSIAMRPLVTAVLLLTWMGLSRTAATPLASGLGRFLLLASAIVLWIDEHWLDFDIRIIVPALLILLLDQALLVEIRTPYEGYAPQALVGIGVVWLAGTLVIGVVISCHRPERPSSDPGNDRLPPNTSTEGNEP